MPNSISYFPNLKSVFLQILYHSSVSCKISPLYFFRSNVIYFAEKKPWKCKSLRLLGAQVNIPQILVIVEFASLFSAMRHNTFLCTFFAKILYNFNKRSLSKYKFGEISCEESKVFNFALWWSFCPNDIKFQLKKYRTVIPFDKAEWCKV